MRMWSASAELWACCAEAVNCLHDVQHHQRRNAGAVRRQLEDLPAAVSRRNRVDPLRAELRQIGGGHRRAAPLEPLDEAACDLSAIERVTAVRGNLPICPREIAVAEDRAERGREPSRQERLRRLWIAAKERRLVVPLFAGNLGHGKSFVGERRRRLEHARERHASEALEEKGPPCDSTRHSDGMDAALRHASGIPALEKLRRQPRGRPSAGVHAVQLPGLLAHDRKQIAADAAHHRADDTHHRVGGNSRVDGMAALREHLGAGLRCQRVFRGDDATRGDDDGTPLRSVNRDFGHRGEDPLLCGFHNEQETRRDQLLSCE